MMENAEVVGYYSWSAPFLKDPILKLIDKVIDIDILRNLLLKYAEWKLYKVIVIDDKEPRPIEAKKDTYYMVRAILRSINRSLARGLISKEVRRVILKVFVRDILLADVPRRKDYIKEHGFSPPTFITISPYKGCNLRCKGCYAASDPKVNNKLEFHIVDKIITQAKALWGMRFFVISGGEPLMYKDDGKTILDIFRKHNDCYFLMYTNGTLIDKNIAKQMAEVGNVTPSISVEGYEKETDERRGKGVFKKILRAQDNLLEFGIPYGFSATITKYNAELFMKKEILDYYFNERNCTYGWMFHYMPIGRGHCVELQPTPEQRVKMFKIEREWIKEGYFIADFWNCGVITNGCISAARPGGYFYVDWDGDVTPCVFIPYSSINIKEVFAKGGTLNDVINDSFMKDIRAWQRSYGYEPKSPSDVQNQIGCCAIRDHYDNFRRILEKNEVKPIDQDAKEALESEEYYKKMVEYDLLLKKLSDPIWKNEYLIPSLKKKKNWKTS